MARAFSGAGSGSQVAAVSKPLRQMANSAGQSLRSVQVSSESVEIRVGDCAAVVPTSVFQALLEILALLGLGHGVRIEALDEELTTEEAARQLGVSRPYLVRLLEKGEIPFRKVGSRRRIRASDLAVYLEIRDRRRREGRAELDKFVTQLGSLLR